MKVLAYFRSLAAKFFHRPRVADEMEQEVRSHIELRAEDLERAGLPRPQAERQARTSLAGRRSSKRNVTRQ